MVTEFRLQKKISGRKQLQNVGRCCARIGLADLLEILVYHLKASTPPVYCFPITTIQSFLLISKAHMFKDG